MSNLKENVEAGVEAMLEHMRDDYRGWSNMSAKYDGETESRLRIKEEMVTSYADGLRYTIGSKYIKVINSGNNSECVEAFVVNTEKDKKFALGDILKPAGWATPARNFRRGNVLERTFERVRWTGPYQKIIMKQTKRQRRAKVPSRPQVNPRKKGKLPWRTFKKHFNQWKLIIFVCEKDGCKAPYRHEHRLMYEE